MATSRTSGPACASTLCAMPACASKDSVPAEMNSPHTLRRGKLVFSTIATDQPARASRSAAVEPAGPAPMTIASNMRDEEVAEEAGAALLEVPAAVHGPERRELAPRESRAHREDGVVARHVVAADQPEHAAAGERQRRAPRLAGDEDIRSCGDEREETAELRGIEMMQKEIRDDRVIVSATCQPVEYVGGGDRDLAAEFPVTLAAADVFDWLTRRGHYDA